MLRKKGTVLNFSVNQPNGNKVGLINQTPTSADQPASSWHLQPQQYQGQRLSRGGGISRNVLRSNLFLTSILCILFQLKRIKK